MNGHDKISKMIEMQEQINARIDAEWAKNQHDWMLAISQEASELIDHFGWKWWKKQEPDMDQVRMEVVDIWHFILSYDIESHSPARSTRQALQLPEEIEASKSSHEPIGVIGAARLLQSRTLMEPSLLVKAFAELMVSMDMGVDSLYRIYTAKNVLNRFRQDMGYRDGTYIKSWSGMEDNEHMTNAMNTLAQFEDRPDYQHILYREMKFKYRESKEA